MGGCGGDESTSAPAPGSVAQPIAAEQAGNEYKIAGAGKLGAGEAMVFVLPDQSQGIVFRTTNSELRALSAKCTHMGCVVEWQKTLLRCPCHGSQFDLTGKAIKGPATKSLPTIKVRQSGEDALVKP
jgi:Rieske Fe-S protein